MRELLPLTDCLYIFTHSDFWPFSNLDKKDEVTETLSFSTVLIIYLCMFSNNIFGKYSANSHIFFFSLIFFLFLVFFV